MKSNKMHLFLITTLMATVSYAITPVHYVEPSLVRYYEYSINLINTHCPSNKIFYPPKTKVNFAKAEVGRYGEKIWVGLCEQTLLSYHVSFDKEWWDTASEADRYGTMAHELVHCSFNEPHNPDPKHFMYESVGPVSLQELNQQLIDYLNKKCDNYIDSEYRKLDLLEVN